MKKTVLTLVASLFLLGAFAQDMTSQRKKTFNASDGLGIKGYDPVAYFMDKKAVKGNKDYNASYQGITYYFSSPVHRAEFLKNPAQYEPQYGGWCAYAMGHDGSKVEVDPETFKIIDGRLFLFYNRFFNNTLKSWNKDEARLHSQADNNWQKLYH